LHGCEIKDIIMVDIEFKVELKMLQYWRTSKRLDRYC